MPTIEIKRFAQGINTQSDSEDSGKFEDFYNLDIDKDGLASRRTGYGDKVDNTTLKVNRGYRWMDINDAGDDYWVFVGEPETGAMVSYGSLATPTATSTSVIADTQIIPFNNKLRFASGRDTKPLLYQYIDREYFLGNWAPAAAINSSNTEITYPSTWDYQNITLHTAAVTDTVSGANKIGYYYYKFVPVFDGNQEAPFIESEAYYNLTSDDKVIIAPIRFDTGDFNQRITHVKVYRSYNALDVEPSFYHIHTIKLGTKADEDGNEGSYSDCNVAKVVYMPGADFTGADADDMFEIDLGENSYEISSYGDGYVILSQSIGTSVSDFGWESSWTIKDTTNATYKRHTDYSPTAHGYYGRDVVYNSSWNFKKDELKDYVLRSVDKDSTGVIMQNLDKVIQVNETLYSAAGGGLTDAVVEIGNKYYYDIDSTVVDLYFYDYGLLDGSPHPLEGRDKISVNYGCGDYLNGRLFVGNVKLDPDGEAEVHRDWIIYSEYLQPDVLPIDNYIQIKDTQGGEIKAIKAYGGDLVVFGERGIFRLQVPTLDPSGWQLTESEKNVNIISPDSIIEVEGMIFFAAKDNVYVITPQFQVYPIANDIKDDYQGTSNLEKTKFIYDIKKQRILCSFGAGSTTLYTFDLRAFMSNGATVWGKIITSLSVESDVLIKDENNVIYIGYHNSNETDFYTLYDASSVTETSHSVYLKSGNFSISDMNKPAMVRRMNISYKNGDGASANKLQASFWLDKSSSKANFYNQNITGQETIDFPLSTSYTTKSIRIGRRASFVKFELSSSNPVVEISKIELEVE
jgi:hypothetical protein